MAGGGVTPANAADLLCYTGVTELHSTARRWVHQSFAVAKPMVWSVVYCRLYSSYCSWLLTCGDQQHYMVSRASA